MMSIVLFRVDELVCSWELLSTGRAGLMWAKEGVEEKAWDVHHLSSCSTCIFARSMG